MGGVKVPWDFLKQLRREPNCITSHVMMVMSEGSLTATQEVAMSILFSQLLFTQVDMAINYRLPPSVQTIKKTIKYCEEHGIPFPKIDESELQDTDDLKDCYIFRGDVECVPTVMHCPLFNKVNCSDKIHEYREQFSTFKMSYSKEEIEKLLTAAKQNVANVHEKILEEIKNVVGPPS